MAANIDSMMYVGTVPWHGLGVKYDEPPRTAQEIVAGGKLDWRVNHVQMYTDLHKQVMNYRAIYREDNNEVLGVVNSARPRLVQNADMFNSVEKLLGKELEVETAASLGLGETVFGCFKIAESYKVLDDKIDHYFVVVNDHLKVDGKVTVLNTPIRVVCQNTLSAALSSSNRKLRIPMSIDTSINSTLATNLMYSVENSADQLQKRAEKFVNVKVDKKYIDNLLDEMFPYKMIDGKIINDVVNERVNLVREQFICECLDADNLQNYKGTQWQVINAIADFSQHYFKNANKAYDLEYRMKLIPGAVPNAELDGVSKYLKIADKLAA